MISKGFRNSMIFRRSFVWRAGMSPAGGLRGRSGLAVLLEEERSPTRSPPRAPPAQPAHRDRALGVAVDPGLTHEHRRGQRAEAARRGEVENHVRGAARLASKSRRSSDRAPASSSSPIKAKRNSSRDPRRSMRTELSASSSAESRPDEAPPDSGRASRCCRERHDASHHFVHRVEAGRKRAQARVLPPDDPVEAHDRRFAARSDHRHRTAGRVRGGLARARGGAPSCSASAIAPDRKSDPSGARGRRVEPSPPCPRARRGCVRPRSRGARCAAPPPRR